VFDQCFVIRGEHDKGVPVKDVFRVAEDDNWFPESDRGPGFDVFPAWNKRPIWLGSHNKQIGHANVFEVILGHARFLLIVLRYSRVGWDIQPSRVDYMAERSDKGPQLPGGLLIV